MAHYAFLDENNIVTEVITGRDEDEVIDGISDWEAYYGEFRGQRCVRTSYNSKIRKQYAGVGYSYDELSDVFISPSPFPSWVLNSNHDWEAPTPRPYDGKMYIWNEEELLWIEINSESLAL